MPRRLPEIGRDVKRLQARHQREANARLAPLGLSIVQWDTLRQLDQNPGASLHRLAELTFQTDQSVGALASRMVRRGLIERVTGPGRAVRHRLTAKGHELRREGERLVADVLKDSFSSLTRRELESFDELLGKLL
jgi:DNA-binding MarR family transcriptional regulator